jgi:hypothetical protein
LWSGGRREEFKRETEEKKVFKKLLRIYICQLAMMMILLDKLVHLGFAYITQCVLNLGCSIDWPLGHKKSDRSSIMLT